jgi:hypothetical protein
MCANQVAMLCAQQVAFAVVGALALVLLVVVLWRTAPRPRIGMCVDMVITWVDGADEEWQATHAKLQRAQNTLTSRATEAELAERRPTVAAGNPMRVYDEAYFSVQSAVRFLPWLRTIHFVAQAPQKPWYWPELQQAAAEQNITLQLVHHDAFMPHDRLPTYSALSIELCLDWIPNLCESFIYFNDDFFVGSPLPVSAFFDSTGRPIYQDDLLHLPERTPEHMWSYILNSSADIMAQTRGLATPPRLRMFSHVALPLTRSQFRVWRKATPDQWHAAPPFSVRLPTEFSPELLMVNMPTAALSNEFTRVVSRTAYSKVVYFTWDVFDDLPSPLPGLFCIQGCSAGRACVAMRRALATAVLPPRTTWRVKGGPSSTAQGLVIVHDPMAPLPKLNPSRQWRVVCVTDTAADLESRAAFATTVLAARHVKVADIEFA